MVYYVIPNPTFFDYFGGVGGHIAHAIGTLSGMANSGLTPVVYCADPSELFRERGIQSVRVEYSTRNVAGRLSWQTRLIRRVRSDCRSARPRFVYLRFSTSLSPWISRLNARLTGAPLILEVNSFRAFEQPLWRHVEGRAFRAASLISCVSLPLARRIVELDSSLEGRVVVIPNGVDAARFEIGEPDDAGILRIGYIGVLKNDYGFQQIVDGVRDLREAGHRATLTFIGDGPYRRELELKVGNLDGVAVEPAVSFDEVPSVMKRFDVLVNTASQRTRFQSPTKLYEYMASGRAILSARTPQTESILGGGEYGLLYDLGDNRELTCHLAKLAGDRPFRLAIGRAARDRAIGEHGWVGRVRDLLREISRRELATFPDET